MKRLGLILIAACAAWMVQAQDLDAVQERMKARKDDVSALLASKTVGENSKGYLEALTPITDQKQSKTLADENADRKVVYAAIAAKTGAKPEVVGSSRAKDVAGKAKPGTMIQQANSSWARRNRVMSDWIDIRKDPAHVAREREKARALRRSVWWHQELERGVCHYCGQRFPASALTMDHVVPVARGGHSAKGNVVPACKACNSSKAFLTPAEQILKQLEDEGHS